MKEVVRSRAGARLTVFLLTCVLTMVACGPNEGSTGTGPAEGELVVSAAASLADAFVAIETVFEDDHPGIDVVLNLGPSSGLREQILGGAPVDVYASADTSNMEEVVAAGVVAGAPQVFVHNLLQIAVPAGNPGRVEGLADLAREELFVGLCAPDVPCGGFARQVLENASVVASVDSDETDVRSLLTKIEAGELDAGITYVTDVVSAAGVVEGVDIPEDLNVLAEYSIAAIDTGANPSGAAGFVAFVLSDRGREILNRYGFVSP